MILMDFPKEFDAINQELLAKLYTHGFSKDAIKLTWSYVFDCGKEQRLITALITA